MAAGPAQLPAVCNRRLAEFLRQVDDTDLVWLEEIREEAARMFSSHYSDEPELMPKTPSQKNRQRRKRLSALREENQELGRKRLSRRRNSSLKLVPSTRYSQRLRNKENLELSRAEAKEVSPPQRVTRSQAAASTKSSEVVPETPPVQQAEGKVPLEEADISDCISAELHLQKSASKPAEKLSTTILLSSDDGSPKESRVAKSPPVPAASELMVPCSPEVNDAGESEAASKLKTAKAANTTVILSEEPSLEEVDVSAQVQEGSDKEPSQRIRDSPGTPTGSRLSRRSVRRSLMGKTSMTRRTSLAEKYSLASKRESMIRKSITRTMVKRKAARKSSVSSSRVDVSSSGEVPEDEETVVKTGPPPGPCTPSKLNPQSPRMSLRSRTVSRNEQPRETSNNESNLNRNGETQEPPQSARRKPSYKRAVDERYDSQQAEDGGLSPPRRKTPSPTFPASKVVRPFKTFLHTVQKNQLLMTPSSVGRNGVIKSFIRYNTPLQSDAKEKERQKLETLRKKQEAEQLRKQKLEEEKKRRLEEAKLKREERLRKVLQARERAEQIEEERKRRIEQKIALFDEKTEKVREERLAEEKIKKKAAARKMEEAEARRRHDEEARKQKALQQEEEERRHKELMQKRKEEEQERARKIAEQRQAEQQREKQLAAERELERKKEQERIQAEKLREQQEKAARLQKEVLAAQEQLHKETEKKEQEEQRLAELKRQEQEQKKLPEEQKAKDIAQTQHLENKENSPACNSYQMTPQAQKDPKPPTINPNNYGMDLNSDDSTDDESQPRKPIPAWATGNQLSQAVIRQYYNPPNVDALFGVIASPKLEDIFYKSKPRYFKRTSSAVWNSPPFPAIRFMPTPSAIMCVS
ncbi:inner centromere protein isoform X1 [Gymnogyps californianus]|uniref:inner centromere protein isoform X1 n=1 Tax=Gymnogyps californianus TaxID=33616 RepID=UPI0021C66FBD|nr:inner centromere protein isoform X1 [Gymnogyps californianus]